MLAVIDRMEDGIAVILMEQKQIEWTTDVANLPDGSTEGTWLIIEKMSETWKIIGIDETATREAAAGAERLQKKLQKKKKRSKFKRS